jgi:selenocysteine lyase/cysteine desulfurase
VHGRGPTVAFHLLRPDGASIDERVCEQAAGRARISVRTGCFCNPGVAEQANGMTPALVHDALSQGDLLDVDGYLSRLRVYAQGAIRASVGPATDSADVDRLLAVCQDVIARPVHGVLAPRIGC